MEGIGKPRSGGGAGGTGIAQLMWAQPSGFWPGHTHVGFSVGLCPSEGMSAPESERALRAQGGRTCEEPGAAGKASRERVVSFGRSKGLPPELGVRKAEWLLDP